MTMTHKISLAVDKLLKTDVKGFEGLACKFLMSSLLMNTIQKRREILKTQLLNTLSSQTQEDIAKAVELVENTDTSANLDLFSGDKLTVCAQVKTGATYVDLEELRKVLGVSEKKFAFAQRKATRRRHPAIVLTVYEKTGEPA